jgi:hypothetical protein
MRLLQAQQDPKSMCTPHDLQCLFRLSEDETAYPIWSRVYSALTFEPPGNDSSEMAFISFWDRNIRDVVDAAITGKSIRKPSRDRSTGLQRPDFGLLLGGVCVFRGEEKPPTYSGRHPKGELIQKLAWTYDPAPYILGQSPELPPTMLPIFLCSGYHAIGPNVTLAAITPTAVVDLAFSDLTWRSQRLRGLIHMIKMCSVITALRNTIGQRNTSEFIAITRE